MRFSRGKTIGLRLTIIIIIVLMLSGCDKADAMKEIKQIIYTSDSGTILPELQWHEEYVIDQDSVTFKRSGRTENTTVNAGEWEIKVDSEDLIGLFDQLEILKYEEIKKIEPQDIPDGGGSESVQIVFSNGKSFRMDLTPGVTYSNGNLIMDPIQSFIAQLEFPVEAFPQQKIQ